MATKDKIVQELELQNEEANKRFRETGDAAEQSFARMQGAADKTNFDKVVESFQAIGEAAGTIGRHADDAVRVLNGVADGAGEVGKSAKSAGASTSIFSSSLFKIVAIAGAVGASLVAVKRQIDNVKQSMADIGDLASSAKEAGVSLDTYQKLDFIFQSLGVSAGKSAELIKEFGQNADEAAEKVVKLSASGRELTAALSRQGVSFAQTKDGMNAMREALARQAQEMGRGRIDAEKLQAVLERFRGSTDPEELIKFANALGSLASQGRSVAEILGQTSTGMGKVITIARPLAEETSGVIKAFADFKRKATPENFEALAEALGKIESSSERAKTATKLLGEELGSRLARAIDVQKDVVGGLAQRYKDLGIGVNDTAVQIADKFNRALTQMNLAMEQGRRELALLFAPALTPLMEKFTDLIRINRGALAEWAGQIRDRAVSALEDLFKLLSSAPDSEISNQWILDLRDGIVSLGDAAKNVFDGIIRPAIAGAVEAFRSLTDIINRVFGSNLSPGAIGLSVVLVAMLGSTKSLIIALTALFGLSLPGFEGMRDALAGLGINVDALTGAFREVKIAILAAFEVAFGPPPEGGRSFMGGVLELLKTIPVLIPVVIAAFVLLKRASSALIPIFRAVFGVEVTALQAGIIGVASLFSGLLTNAMVTAAAAATLVVTGIRGIVLLFEIVAKLNPFVAIIVTLALLAANFDKVAAAIDPVVRFLGQLFGVDISGAEALEKVILALAAALTVLAARAFAANAAVLPFLITVGGIALAVASALALIRDFTSTGGKIGDLERKQEELTNAFRAGALSTDEYREALNRLQREQAETGSATDALGNKTRSATQGMTDDFARVSERIRAEMEKSRAEAEKGIPAPKIKGDGGSSLDGSTLPFVERFKRGAAEVQSTARQTGSVLGKVIAIPQSAESAIENIMRGINEDLRELSPQPIERIQDGFDALKKKVSEISPEFEDAGSVISTELSAARKKATEFAAALDDIDKRSAKIQGSSTGLGKGSFPGLTEQLGDPSMFTDMVAGARKAAEGVQELGQEAATSGAVAKDAFTQKWGVSLQTLQEQMRTVKQNADGTVDGLTKVDPAAFAQKWGVPLERLQEQMKEVRQNADGTVSGLTKMDPTGFAQKWGIPLETLQEQMKEIKQGVVGAQGELAKVPPAAQKVNDALSKGGGAEAAKKMRDAFQELNEEFEDGADGTEELKKLQKAMEDLIRGKGSVDQVKKALEELDEQVDEDDESAVAALEKFSTALENFGKAAPEVKKTSEVLGETATKIAELSTNAGAAITNVDALRQKLQELQAVRPPTSLDTPPGAAPGTAPTSTEGAGAGAAAATAATTAANAATNALTTLKAAADAVRAAMAAINQEFTTLGSVAPGSVSLLASILGSLPSIMQQTEQAAAAFGATLQRLPSDAQSLAGAITGLPPLVAQAFAADAVAAFDSAMQSVSGTLQGIVASLQTAVQLAQQLAALGGGGGGGGAGYSTGGRIPGQGSGDTVPIMATPGEWVIRASAVRRLVRQFGGGVMHAINSGQLPQGFNLGGLISPSTFDASRSLRFAGGGSVPSRDLGTLRLGGFPDGRVREVRADEDTVAALERVVQRQSGHSMKKPSWY